MRMGELKCRLCKSFVVNLGYISFHFHFIFNLNFLFTVAPSTKVGCFSGGRGKKLNYYVTKKKGMLN